MKQITKQIHAGKAACPAKVLRLILAIVLIAIITPMSIAGIYNRANADDFVQAYETMRTWQSTGSIFQTLLTAFKESFRIWNWISGIFFAMFLCALPPMIFDYRLAWIHPIVAMVFLSASAIFACRTLRIFGKDIPKTVLDCIGLLLSIFLLLFMPNVAEGLYWHTGMMVYVFTISWAICFFCGWLRICWRTQPPKWATCLMFSIALFLVGGSNNITSVSCVVLCGYFAITLWYQRKSWRCYLPLLFMVLGFGVAMFSPGNMNRQAMTLTTEAASLIPAFLMAFHRAFFYLFENARCWLAVLVLLPFIAWIIPKFQCSFQRAWIVPLASIAFLAAHFFPFTYTDYPFFSRHSNACFISKLLILTVNAIALCGYGYFQLGWKPSRSSKKPGMVLAAAAMVLILILSFPGLSFDPFEFGTTLPPLKAISNLMDGQLQTYAKEYDALVERVQTHPNEDIRLPLLPTSEYLGPLYLTEYPSAWENEGFVRFYGGDGVTIAYAP